MELYTLGNLDFIIAVLNGLALFTGSDTFIAGMTVAALSGVLLILGKGIATQTVDLHYFFVGLLIFIGGFFITFTVTVEDIYDGNTQDVANVPAIVAIPGTITTTFGVVFTEAVETFFSTPNLSDEGFMSPLRTLQRIRNLEPTRGDIPATNTALYRSWFNYIRECTIRGIDSGTINPETIKSSDNLQDSLQNPATVSSTQLFIGTPTFYTCDGAWTPLTNATNAMLTAGSPFSNYLIELTELDPAAPGNPWPELDDALNLSTVPAPASQTGGLAPSQQYVLNRYLETILIEATQDQKLTEGDVAGLIMITQAAEQRQTKHAAEHEMFTRIIQPLMAMIEVLVIALVPFLAIMLMFGFAGIRAFAQYLLVWIWLQLWFPILSIVNFFMHLSMENVIANSISPYSMDGYVSFQTSLADYISTGGLIASIAPALGATLLTGGILSGLKGAAGRASGGEFVNPRVATPDIQSVGAVNTVQSPYTSNPTTGTTQAGYNAPTISVDNTQSSAVSGARSKARAASASYADSLLYERESGANLTSGSSTSNSIRDAVTANNSATSTFVDNNSARFAKAAGITTQEFRANVTDVNGNISTPKILETILPANASAGVSTRDSTTQTTNTGLQQAIQRGINNDESLKADLGQALAADTQTAISKNSNLRQSEEFESNYSSGLNAVRSAQNNLTSAESIAQRSGIQESAPITEVANEILKQDQRNGTDLAGELQALTNNASLNTQQEALGYANASSGKVDSNLLPAASQIKALSNGTPQEQQQFAQLFNKLDAYSNLVSANPSNPQEISGEPSAPSITNADGTSTSADAIENTAQQNVSAGSSAAQLPQSGDIYSKAQQNENTRSAQITSGATGPIQGASAVELQNNQNQVDFSQDAINSSGEFFVEKAQEFESQLDTQGSNTASGARDLIAGYTQNVSEKTGRVTSDLASFVVGGLEAATEARSNNATLSETVGAFTQGASSGISAGRQARVEQYYEQATELGFNENQSAYYAALKESSKTEELFISPEAFGLQDNETANQIRNTASAIGREERTISSSNVANTNPNNKDNQEFIDNLRPATDN